jgi:hypothetical protein
MQSICDHGIKGSHESRSILSFRAANRIWVFCMAFFSVIQLSRVRLPQAGPCEDTVELMIQLPGTIGRHCTTVCRQLQTLEMPCQLVEVVSLRPSAHPGHRIDIPWDPRSRMRRLCPAQMTSVLAILQRPSGALLMCIRSRTRSRSRAGICVAECQLCYTASTRVSDSRLMSQSFFPVTKSLASV